MSAEIVQLADRMAPLDYDGVRQVLEAMVAELSLPWKPSSDGLGLAEAILVRLWMDGYKIVRLEDRDWLP